MACNLTKIIGRSSVTKYREETRRVWVDPPPRSPTPPKTPPIGTTLPPGSSISVPWRGSRIESCKRAGGKKGFMIVSTLADGSVTRSACIANEGLSV